MNCTECRENLVSNMEGLLTPEAASQCRAHLETCAACRAESAEIARLRQRLATSGRLVETNRPRAGIAKRGTKMPQSNAGESAPNGMQTNPVRSEVETTNFLRLKPGGFWVRLAALWTDVLTVWIVVKLMSKILCWGGIYIPIELVTLVLLLVYAGLLTGWKSWTIGKKVFGLTVRDATDKSLGFARSFLREAIGKPISALCLFLGFFWIGFTRKKRGWHDYLAGTVVIKSAVTRRWPVLLVSLVTCALIVPQVWRSAVLFRESLKLRVGREVKSQYADRSPSELVDANTLKPTARNQFTQWLNEHGEHPADYAIRVAGQHSVTLFGELHGRHANLEFLNQIIPELYHRAGVTCVALEACMAEDNGRLARLVTAPEFDATLAMQIARDSGWPDWGWKGYWDVFETVWRLNRSLPAGRRPMRVIGIDTKWDGASFALLGLGDDGIRAPIWEKLRIVRVLGDLVSIVRRDEIMARNIEKEILEKDERGIVLVGASHASLRYRQPTVVNGKVVREWSRMGFLLHQKYGDQLFEILLHNQFHSAAIARFLEQAAEGRSQPPVGFDVAGSPLAVLRDPKSASFKHQAGVCFADLADGYIFLKPGRELKQCEWTKGFISREMFYENKPYFEARCGKTLRNAKEANRYYEIKTAK